MSAHLLNGKLLADKIKNNLREEIASFKKQCHTAPGLAVILVGDDAASQVYVNHKQRAAEALGMNSSCHRLPSSTTQQQLSDLITQLNHDKNIHGILLQLPLPTHLNSDQLLELIDPLKDVDGFHPYNLGRLAQKRPLLRPCTPYGVMQLLAQTQLELAGKNAVVVGASNIVGRPMALELLFACCTVTICHSRTVNLAEHIRQADILVAAIGKRNIIKSDWLKPGVIAIDVGIHREADNKLYGDLDFTTAAQKAAWITPVPGGVGPMTVATLMQNTLLAAKLQHRA